MKRMKDKALVWALLALGAAIVALGIGLALALPAEARTWSASRGPGCALSGQPFRGEAPAAPGTAPGEGYQRGFDGMSPRAFGRLMPHPGTLAIGLIAILVIALLIHGRRCRRAHEGRECREEDAVAILRREFAEGTISEEVYRQRLEALGK